MLKFELTICSQYRYQTIFVLFFCNHVVYSYTTQYIAIIKINISDTVSKKISCIIYVFTNKLIIL